MKNRRVQTSMCVQLFLFLLLSRALSPLLSLCSSKYRYQTRIIVPRQNYRRFAMVKAGIPKAKAPVEKSEGTVYLIRGGVQSADAVFA